MRARFHRDTAVLAALMLGAFFAHLATATAYPMFVDEFYYLACADHLSWGYVDHPPLSIAVLGAWRAIFGDGLLAMRFLPAVAAALMIFFVWKLVAELGGGRFARVLAALALFFAPQQRVITGFYSMNAFDLLFWAAALWILIRLAKTDNTQLWLPFGLVVGLGLLNKISLLYFGAGLVIALLLTPLRRHVLKTHFWLGGALALGLFLPYVLWNAAHDWPTLEFIRDASTYKNIALSPPAFLGQFALENNPLTALIWLPGLLALLFGPRLRAFRLLGYLAVVVLAVVMAQNGKPYYVAGLTALLLAAGAVWLEHGLSSAWARGAFMTALVLGGLALLPFGLRVLPPQTFLAYQQALGIQPPPNEKGHAGAVLPQTYGDSFGWQELAATVVTVYRSLPPEEQRDCVIVGRSYGDTDAINYYARGTGLPPAVCTHNSHFYWGPPPITDQTTFLLVGHKGQEYTDSFDSCRVAAMVPTHPFAMPGRRHLQISVCRYPKAPIAELWKRSKNFG